MHELVPLLASTGGHDGHWWIVFPLFWAIVVVLLIALLWRRWGRGPRDGDPARRILGERFARGEINADEYRERLAQLQ